MTVSRYVSLGSQQEKQEESPLMTVSRYVSVGSQQEKQEEERDKSDRSPRQKSFEQALVLKNMRE